MANTWTTKTALLGTRSTHGGGQCGIGTNTAYLVGGIASGGVEGGSAVDTNEEYSQSGDSWAGKAVLAGPKKFGAVTSIGTDKLYYFGGQYPTNPTVNNAEYSKTGNSWSNKTVLPAATDRTCAGAIGADKAYHYNGADGVHREYSQSGDSWATKTSTSFTGWPTYQSVFESSSDTLVFCHGKKYGSAGGTNETREYSQSGNSWTNKTNAPYSRRGCGNGQSSNKGYVYGGCHGTGGTLASDVRNYTAEYDPSGNSWVTKADMPGNRGLVGSASLGTYYTYAFGGYDSAANHVNTNYQYTAADPPTYDALEDLRSFLDARWPFAMDDLKLVLEALGWSLEDLRSEIQTRAYTVLEDLKVELGGNVWGFEDLRSFLDGHAQSLEDFRADITTSDLVFGDLRCELKTRDTQGPYVFNYPSPPPGQTGVPVNADIALTIRDDGWGVDIDSVWVEVDGIRYKKGNPGFSYSGTPREYVVTIDPAADFEYNRSVSVRVFAADLAGNPGLNLVMQ